MEAVIHPLVRKSFKDFVESQKKQGVRQVFYEAPLISLSLFESVDKSILVTCLTEIRKERLLKKSWTLQEIEERLSLQIPDSQVRDRADFIIDNGGNLKDLENQMDEVLKKLC